MNGIRSQSRAVVAPLRLIVLCFTWAIVAIASFFNPSLADITLPFLASFTVLLLMWRTLGPIWQSPALIFACVMIAMGFFGYLFADELSGVGGTAGAVIHLSTDERRITAWLFFLTATFALLGSRIILGKKYNFFTTKKNSFKVDKNWQRAAILFVYFTLFTNLAFRGIGWLLARPERFDEGVGAVQSLLSFITLIACVLAGLAIAGPSKNVRLMGWIGVLILACIYFALASRALALLPLLVLAGALAGGATKRILWKTLVSVLTAILLLPVPLYSRGLDSHGIIPYLQGLPEIFSGENTWLASANNVLSGFEVVGAVAFSARDIPMSTFWISLSPLTGNAAGWYEVSRTVRLNEYTPYAALGEIANQGYLILIAFSLALGIAMGCIQRIGRYLSKHPILNILNFGSIGLIVLFTVQFAHYNLRSEMRLIYYSLALSILLFLLSKINNSVKNKH